MNRWQRARQHLANHWRRSTTSPRRQDSPVERPTVPPPPPPLPQRQAPPLRTWTVFAGAAVVVVVTGMAVWWLQGAVPGAGAVGAELERAKLRVETIRTGLSVGAAAGAALALLLAFRRQQLSERDHLLAQRAQYSTEHDAAERRVTELYVKAADQLGSDKAPVRLAGLYALERLAQDNPVHRQSIVEVICAYLRMPYTPPVSPAAATSDAEIGVIADQTAAADNVDKPATDPSEERQVRLAAQRILARHLKPPFREEESYSPYWGFRILDLSEATLIDFDLSYCDLRRANFKNATFHGGTRFIRTTFTDVITFVGATFNGEAQFFGAKFDAYTVFTSTTFNDRALFDQTRFIDTVLFDQAAFNSEASFSPALFLDDVVFKDALFKGPARFPNTRCDAMVELRGVVVGSGDRLHDIWPEPWRFDEATRTLVQVPRSQEMGLAASADASSGSAGRPVIDAVHPPGSDLDNDRVPDHREEER